MTGSFAGHQGGTPSPQRRYLAVFAVALIAMVLASCTSIPHSSSVHRLSDNTQAGRAPSRYTPAGPSEEATPSEIVRGFLDAMLAYPSDRATARKFLTEKAAKQWTPGSATRVYSTAAVLTSDSDDGTNAQVDASVSLTAQLDRDGHLTATDDRRSIGFELTHDDGQWRISSAPAGLLISQKYFRDHYGIFNLYYFDAAGEQLVADPVHAAIGEQTATDLVTRLLHGPRTELKDHAQTYLPDRSTLNSSIPVSKKGVAEVVLSADTSHINTSHSRAISAQITWTLAQIEEVKKVRIRGPKHVLAPDGHRLHDKELWDRFGHQQTMSFARRNGKLHQLDGATSKPIAGPWGEDEHDIDSAAIGGDTIAVIDDHKLRVGRLDDDTLAEIGATGSTTGSTIEPISAHVDTDASVLVASRDSTGNLIARYDRENQRLKTVLRLHGKSKTDSIDQFLLSPDGARYAIVTSHGDQRAVAIGYVHRDDEAAARKLTQPVELESISSAEAVTWASPTSLLIAAGGQSGTTLDWRAIDGSSAQHGDFDANVPASDVADVSMTGGDDPTIYVLDKSRQLWAIHEAGEWQRVNGIFAELIAGH